MRTDWNPPDSLPQRPDLNLNYLLKGTEKKLDHWFIIVINAKAGFAAGDKFNTVDIHM